MLPARAETAGIIRAWPAVGAWKTLLTSLPDGRASCSLTTRRPPWGPAEMTLAFTLTATGATLQLAHEGPRLPAAPRLRLLADGQELLVLPVLSQDATAQGHWLLTAALPGGSLAAAVLPGLTFGQELEVEIGSHRIAVPTPDAGRVMAQLQECAAAGNRIQGG